MPAQAGVMPEPNSTIQKGKLRGRILHFPNQHNLFSILLAVGR